MSKKTVILVILLLISVSGYAQVVIEGTVYDKAKKAQSGISVTLNNPKTGGIFSYAFTDTQGAFKFNYSGNVDTLSVAISGLNIPKQKRIVKAVSQRLDFTIEIKATEIKEVLVKGSPIYGTRDTINYAVGSFLTEDDVAIEDVIKKLPGISVDNSGVISYQGKTINKFYIENMDLLDGRYGIATKNIAARDINTVQILENHQPIRALTDIKHSNQAAMNLKLKEEAKGIFMLNAQPGIGIEFGDKAKLLWNNSLTGMYFGKKKQNISLYKGNNSGNDLSTEFTSHTARDYFGNQNMLYVRIPSPPAISTARYLFNNSHAVTFNELRKTKNNAEIKLNLVYFNDQIKRHGYSRTSYYIPNDDMIILEEDVTSRTDINRLEGDINYNVNDPGKFLNNLLKFEGVWEKALGNVITSEDITQRSKIPNISVTDHFNIIKSYPNQKGFTLSASAGFKNSPQILKINRGLYPDVLNGGEEYYGLRQSLDMQKAYANASGSLLSLFSLGRVKFDPTLSADAQYSTLKSDLFLKDAAGNYNMSDNSEMTNDLRWLKISADLGISVRYTYKDLKVNVALPLAYSYFGISDRKKQDNQNHHRLFFQPNLQLEYKLQSKITLNASYGLNNSTGDIQSLYGGYVLQNYRSLNRYDGRLLESKSNGGRLSIEYKNLINMLFARIGVNYRNVKNNMLTEQTFQDILIISSRLPISNRSQSYGIDGEFSKGFDFWSLLLKCRGAYYRGSSQLLRQGELIDSRYDGVNISGRMSMKPVKFILLSYDGKWGRSSSWISSGEKYDPINSMIHNVSLSVPIKKISIKAGYEYYYNSAGLGNKNFSFTDIAISYRLKKVDMNLEWRNIFNTQSYITTYYSEANMYQNVYNIRPTSIMFTIRFKIL